jgi:hypothetical protein
MTKPRILGGARLKIAGGPIDPRGTEIFIERYLNGYNLPLLRDYREALTTQRFKEAEDQCRRTLDCMVSVWIRTRDAVGHETTGDAVLARVLSDLMAAQKDLLHAFFARNPVRLSFHSRGGVVADDYQPVLNSGQHLVFAAEYAIYWFLKLSDSPTCFRLARCAWCTEYFVYRRTQNKPIKFGTYCDNCKGKGRAHQTHERRKGPKKELIEWAAEAYDSCPPSRLNSSGMKVWILNKINLRLMKHRKDPKHTKWVTQNLVKIQAESERRANTKR